MATTDIDPRSLRARYDALKDPKNPNANPFAAAALSRAFPDLHKLDPAVTVNDELRRVTERAIGPASPVAAMSNPFETAATRLAPKAAPATSLEAAWREAGVQTTQSLDTKAGAK